MTSMFWLQLYKSVSKAILHGYEFSDICVKFYITGLLFLHALLTYFTICNANYKSLLN